MAGSIEQDRWIDSFLGVQVPTDGDGRLAIPGVSPEADWDALYDILMQHIFPKIPDYAATDGLRDAWTARADAIEGAWQKRDPATGGMIASLGREMTEEAGRRAEDAAPLKAWRSAFARCRTEAAGLKATLLAQLDHAGEADRETGFNRGWSIFEQEFAAVDSEIEGGFGKARRVAPNERPGIVETAVADARRLVEYSRVLREIDGSAEHRTSIVRELDAALDAFASSAGAVA